MKIIRTPEVPYPYPEVPYPYPEVPYLYPEVPYLYPEVPFTPPKVSFTPPEVLFTSPKAPFTPPEVPFTSPKVPYSTPEVPYAPFRRIEKPNFCKSTKKRISLQEKRIDMFKHNLKIAFRNLWKYKTQTSIIGLAIGFTCFSLATLWIRYEMTYDSFHKNADNLYVVTAPNERKFNKIDFQVPYPLAAYLKETFPEVKEALSISGGRVRTTSTFEIENRKVELYSIFADFTFLKMFDVKILEGNLDFTDYSKKEIAITQDKAQTIFGKESPVGKILSKEGEEYLITAVVSSYSTHSNFPFDILGATQRKWREYERYDGDPFTREWGNSNCIGILELYPNVDVETFKQKLHEHEIIKTDGGLRYMNQANTSLIALTDLRIKDITMVREIKFQHIKLFALMGILVIFCALFNYLTLFVSRFKIREKELALRIVCGASLRSLFSLLLIEFLITLLVATLLGLVFVNLVSPTFLLLSEIQMNLGSIYVELILYISAIILLTVLLFAFTLAVFRRYALNISIRRTNNQLFRKTSIIVQLIISIGFVFCTAVMIKQIRHLHNNKNIGFEYKNRSFLSVYDMATAGYWSNTADVNAVYNKMKQIPEITDLVVAFVPLAPISITSMGINAWDGLNESESESFYLRNVYISEAFADFYGLQLMVGEMLTDEDGGQSVLSKKVECNVLINESAMQFFGWDKDSVIGKRFGYITEEYSFIFRVKGVVKNIYNDAPTVEVPPFFYHYRYTDIIVSSGILFKYTNRHIAEAKIRELLRNEFPDIPEYRFDIRDTEDAYEKFFKSEKALITILNFMSAICVLISVFGFFSLVSLSCEERRKEIAIRKVNGANVHDIIAIFFKEYSLLLAIGAAIAFPLGYYIMKGWLEQYINQTNIDAWIYAAILLSFATIIVICVGWRVYKTSRENPADVVKSE